MSAKTPTDERRESNLRGRKPGPRILAIAAAAS